MAALANCKTCKKEISPNAKSCPHCGEPSPLPPTKAANAVGVGCGLVLVGVIVMIIIGVLTSGNDNSSKPVPAASVSESGNSGGDTIKPQTIVGDNRFGCVDRDYFEKLGSYAVDKDNVAFSNALSLGVINGECVLSKRTSRYSLPIPLYSRVL